LHDFAIVNIFLILFLINFDWCYVLCPEEMVADDHLQPSADNSTTTLFAALSMLDGTIIGDCLPRHRHQEFIRFLKKMDAETPAGLNLNLIVDNYGTYKHPKVTA